MRLPIVLSSAALVTIACASSKPAEKAPVEVQATGTPGEAVATRDQKVRATVKSVDVAKRTLTVQEENGQTETITVDPAVRRLDEIAPGDVVQVEMREGLLLQYQAPGTESYPTQAAVAADVAGSGTPPGVTAVGGLQGTVTIIGLDQGSRTVTFQDSEGTPYKVKAGPKIALEKLKVGDRLLATYVQSVAVSVERAAR